MAEARRERKDRQQEDRAGLRPFEACKRARQEAFSIPRDPSEFGPAAAPAQRRVHTRRRPPGGWPPDDGLLHGGAGLRSRYDGADLRTFWT